MEYKTCTKCEDVLPATNGFFYRNKHGKFGLRGMCKKCYKIYSDKYYTSNKKKILKYNKQYRLNNFGYMKQWHLCNVEAVREYSRQYNEDNRDRKKQYYRENREYVLKRQQRYYLDNYKQRLNYNKQYYRTESGINSRREGGNRHYKNNKLSCCIASYMYKALKQNKRYLHWETFVPYILEELTLHLQKSIGLMNKVILDEFWKYFYGKYYHVDHIRPIASFNKDNLRNPRSREFQACWALKNLQLLSSEENLKKGAKLNYIRGGLLNENSR